MWQSLTSSGTDVWTQFCNERRHWALVCENIKITVCIKKNPNRVLYDSLSRGCTTHDWRRGFWCFCLRSALSLADNIPSQECGPEIGCASSPAVLQRTRSLQLGSVWNGEPREKPCDPSQTRRGWSRLETFSVETPNSLTAAQTLDMATSILGVSLALDLCAKVVRKVSSSLLFVVLINMLPGLSWRFRLLLSYLACLCLFRCSLT